MGVSPNFIYISIFQFAELFFIAFQRFLNYQLEDKYANVYLKETY